MTPERSSDLGGDSHSSADALDSPGDEESEIWLLGVELALTTPEVFVIQVEQDLGGHELALLDFDPALAARLRRIGAQIAIRPRPGIRSGLAISGSSAQGLVNPYPCDFDFFERIHISAPDRTAAVAVLAEVVRANALDVAANPAFSPEEVRLGRESDGSFLSWTYDELLAGRLERGTSDVSVSWSDAAADPGMVKLDWFYVDPDSGKQAKVTKVVDATWSAPGGVPESLDGLIDAEFQQVYLSAEGARLAAEVAARSATELEIGRYADFMAEEVRKFRHREPPDHLKAAKRLYNLCRATGRFAEALWIRELLSSIASGDAAVPGRVGIVVEARMADERQIAVLLEAIDRDAPGPTSNPLVT